MKVIFQDEPRGPNAITNVLTGRSQVGGSVVREGSRGRSDARKQPGDGE